MNRSVKLGITTLLIFMMIFSMTGCRKSEVIEEILYSQDVEEIDYDNDTTVADNNKDSENKDENLPANKKDNTDSKKEPQKVAAADGEDENSGKAPQSDPKKNGGRDKIKDDDKGDDNSGTGGAGETDKTPGDDTGNGGGGLSEDPDANEVTDGNGDPATVPNIVNHVVAAGDSASIVQMLGGKEALVGSSADYLNNNIVQAVFSDENISQVKSLWNDGETTMSDSNFRELLKLKPDLCVGITGGYTFSANQKSELDKNGIGLFNVNLQSHSRILDSVKSLGVVMKNMKGREGESVNNANRYSHYSEELINDVNKIKGPGTFTWGNRSLDERLPAITNKTSDGKYTLFVSDWDSSARYVKISGGVTQYSETGLAAVSTEWEKSPVHYYLSKAGVCNSIARLNGKGNFAAIPLLINATNSEIKNSNLGIGTYVRGEESFTNVDGICLGETGGDFPAIIVDSAKIKNGIESSKMWTTYEPDPGGTSQDYVFPLDDGDEIATYIRGGYDIHINPSGVGSWTGGSVESVLETIWASSKFYNKYTNNQVREEIKEFYREFYRCENAPVSDILAGR